MGKQLIVLFFQHFYKKFHSVIHLSNYHNLGKMKMTHACHLSHSSTNPMLKLHLICFDLTLCHHPLKFNLLPSPKFSLGLNSGNAQSEISIPPAKNPKKSLTQLFCVGSHWLQGRQNFSDIMIAKERDRERKRGSLSILKSDRICVTMRLSLGWCEIEHGIQLKRTGGRGKEPEIKN